MSGNDTRSVATAIRRADRLDVGGYLIATPHYNRLQLPP
jgi:hypothetical protein